MRVTYQRTGGFAGMRLSTTVDSQSLDEQETQALLQEIEGADFFRLPSRILSEGGGADRFEYQITVERDNQQHAVTIGETAMPDSLRPLVEHLERLMRSQRR